MKKNSKEINFKQLVSETLGVQENSQIPFVKNLANQIARQITEAKKTVSHLEENHAKEMVKTKERLSQLQTALMNLQRGNLEAVVSCGALNIDRAEAKKLFPDKVKDIANFTFTSSSVPFKIYADNKTNTFVTDLDMAKGELLYK